MEYSEAYSKTSAIKACGNKIQEICGNEPGLDNNRNIIDFPDDNNNSASFKFKQKIKGQTRNGGTKDAEVMFLLRYLSNFWRTLVMPLINCEISLQLK